MQKPLLIVAILTAGLWFATPASASVRCVQEALNALGYSLGTVDGIIGPRTRDMARNWASDYGQRLPAFSSATSEQWCSALEPFWKGAGHISLTPETLDAATPSADSPACVTAPDNRYARRISAMVDGDELALTISARFGGAVESLTWRGKEFLNIYDHGRQISYAWQMDGWGECLNPTEPGAAADLFNQTSTSELISVCSSAPNHVTTIVHPAYWLAPGEAGFCDRGATSAVNEELVSDQTFEKSVTIGYGGIDNVIAFDATITLPRDYYGLQLEIPTAYLTGEFSARYRFNPRSGELTEPDSDPRVEPWSFNHASLTPPILATEDGQFAMGAYTNEPIATYELLFYDVPNPYDRTNKLNMVLQERPAPAGDYHYLTFLIVGTLDEVQSAMRELYDLHKTDSAPPAGYVDTANCDEISGWAWDPKTPNEPVTIEIYEMTETGRGELLYSGTADRFRSDLPPVLGDNGEHGYRFWTYQVLPDGARRTIRVEAVNSVDGLPNQALSPSQVTLACPNL